MKRAILTQNLRKSFPKKDGFYEAVSGVNLAVMQGEVFGFLGPNGAGKTTTLRMLTTLLEADQGEISVAGFDVRKQSHLVRQHIGYVSQSGGADSRATGMENLLLQGQLHGMKLSQAKQQAEAMIQLFSLQEGADQFVSTYSGGQRRRLDIALGIMHHPDILFLDEPTIGLDPQNRVILWEQIRLLQNQGITIFLTSHYLDEIDLLSDRLAIMDHGKIVAEGSPKELKKQISGDVISISFKRDEQIDIQMIETLKKRDFIREITQEAHNMYLYVQDGEVAIPQILQLLESKKISLQTISLSAPSLNDVFLNKTGRSLRKEVKELNHKST